MHQKKELTRTETLVQKQRYVRKYIYIWEKIHRKLPPLCENLSKGYKNLQDFAKKKTRKCKKKN